MNSSIHRVVVYLSSSGRVSPEMIRLSTNLGTALTTHGYGLVFGGMDLGPMGRLANAAMSAGGNVIGIVPKKLRESAFVHKAITKSTLVDTLGERKRLMFDLSQAVIVLPGGFGTLDEAADVLYWATLDLHNKPIIFINSNGFWDDMMSLYHKALLPFPDAKKLVRCVSSINDAMSCLQEFSQTPRTITIPYQQLPSLEEDVMAASTPLMIEDTDIKSITLAIAAILCKQLNLSQRPIGVVNKNGFYDPLFRYIQSAYQERFITEECLTLMKHAPDRATLLADLQNDTHITVDLAKKWGKSEPHK